jgi:hypothetical protein
MMTNEVAWQLVGFFMLETVLFTMACIAITYIRRKNKKLQYVATCCYALMKQLKLEDPIHFDSVVRKLPDIEKVCVRALFGEENKIEEQEEKES